MTRRPAQAGLFIYGSGIDGAVSSGQDKGMDSYVITLPKGCACRTTEIGDHSNQVELVTPGHMVALGSIGCLAIRSTTCVDRCIADLVQAFWAAGLVTTGCCCGHNQQEGYIGLLRPI